jgi:hypothetical protein
MTEVIGKLLVGWLIADLMTGLFHWWEDRVATETMPVIGARIVTPNRLHHIDPMAFTRNNLWARSGETFIGVAAIAAVWFWLIGPSLVLLAATVGGALSTEIHYQTHAVKQRRPLVRMLQEIGIIQSPGQHAQHHRSPSDRRYCIVSDWLNPVLDQMKVWSRLETLLTRVGLEPNRGTR